MPFPSADGETLVSKSYARRQDTKTFITDSVFCLLNSITALLGSLGHLLSSSHLPAEPCQQQNPFTHAWY